MENMENRRSDIEVFIRRNSITVLSSENQITFSSGKKETISLFATAEFKTNMLDELEKSRIIRVESYSYSDESSLLNLTKQFGFKNETFIDVLISLIEKYNL